MANYRAPVFDFYVPVYTPVDFRGEPLLTEDEMAEITNSMTLLEALDSKSYLWGLVSSTPSGNKLLVESVTREHCNRIGKLNQLLMMDHLLHTNSAKGSAYESELVSNRLPVDLSNQA